MNNGYNKTAYDRNFICGINLNYHLRIVKVNIKQYNSYKETTEPKSSTLEHIKVLQTKIGKEAH